MRFRFCGDSDCPDWILAEINTMTRLSSVKMKLLSQQVAKSLLEEGEDIDYDKVKKLTGDAKFDVGDMKACLGALTFVLTSACTHGVDEETLNSELQQLGMPKEHATALCKVHNEHITPITDKLRNDSLRLSRLEDVSYRVDLIAGTSSQPVDQKELSVTPEVHIGLHVIDPATDKATTHHLCLAPSQLHLLISEMKRATTIMESLQSTQ